MEANARRRSEQVVTEERAKRKALEDHLRRQAQSARPLLEELTGLFQRAGPVSDSWKTFEERGNGF
jgi:hypothetical protein